MLGSFDNTSHATRRRLGNSIGSENPIHHTRERATDTHLKANLKNSVAQSLMHADVRTCGRRLHREIDRIARQRERDGGKDADEAEGGTKNRNKWNVST